METQETMKDMEKELEESYKMMGDGEHDTDTLLAWQKIMELYEAKAIAPLFTIPVIVTVRSAFAS